MFVYVHYVHYEYTEISGLAAYKMKAECLISK